MGGNSGLVNFRELNKVHKKIMNHIESDIAESIERTGIKLFQELQIGTPKDLGMARNGWIVKVDSPPSEWSPQTGLSTYDLLSFPKNEVKFDSFVWISNNVDYIEALENGHSQLQAPDGMSEPAIRHTILYLQQEIDRLNRITYG